MSISTNKDEKKISINKEAVIDEHLFIESILICSNEVCEDDNDDDNSKFEKVRII